MSGKKIPNHIAVIMDGNGRWAKKRFLPHSAGHRAGAQTLRKIAEYAGGIGVKYLTAYAFSTENWTRPADEVAALMGLIHEYIEQYINDSKKNDMRITIIGDMSGLDEGLRGKIQYLEEYTADKPGMNLIIALNYGGRDEIVRAARRMCKEVTQGGLSPDTIDIQMFERYLDTAGVPDPDLLIRTSESRLSNFLLWQTAYTEMYFLDKLWPDFSTADLDGAIEAFNARDRRYGGRKQK